MRRLQDDLFTGRLDAHQPDRNFLWLLQLKAPFLTTRWCPNMVVIFDAIVIVKAHSASEYCWHCVQQDTRAYVCVSRETVFSQRSCDFMISLFRAVLGNARVRANLLPLRSACGGGGKRRW